jgi:hypothetical protein
MDHVSWSLGLLSKTTSWEVGPTHNWESMTLRVLTFVDLYYFIMLEDPHESTFIEIAYD